MLQAHPQAQSCFWQAFQAAYVIVTTAAPHHTAAAATVATANWTGTAAAQDP